MTSRKLRRAKDDHPEHFLDEICRISSATRSIPTDLATLLLEQSGHRCTICRAQYAEIHHIDYFSQGGRTEYNNLIVLCPNCHTGVHKGNTPTPDELRNYKLKQEIEYALPVYSRVTDQEIEFLNTLSLVDADKRIYFAREIYKFVAETDPVESKRAMRESIGLGYIESFGLVSVVTVMSILTEENGVKGTDIRMEIRPTGKGLSWLRHLEKTGRFHLLGQK
jgi:hypothetical protein